MSVAGSDCELSENALHEQARRRAGYSDFGSSNYLVGLRALLTSLHEDLQLTTAGHRTFHDSLLEILTARLYAQRGWSVQPRVLDLELHAPLVITGLPRSGTTALHRLLALDPQFQTLEMWLLHAPMPRPPPERWSDYAEYRSCVAACEKIYRRAPEIRSMHSFGAAQAEECRLLLMQDFVHGQWASNYPLLGYQRWFESQSTLASYRRYADILRLIGSAEPMKSWLLKSPRHMAEIDSLLAVFPDARIVQTHRDPRNALPSLCSFVNSQRRGLAHDLATEHLGPKLCDYLHMALERMRVARAERPHQFFDVSQRQLLAEPLATVHSIYRHFGLELSSLTEQRMLAAPASKQGDHRYVTADYGLDAARISAMFSDYLAQHHFD